MQHLSLIAVRLTLMRNTLFKAKVCRATTQKYLFRNKILPGPKVVEIARKTDKNWWEVGGYKKSDANIDVQT